MHIKSSFSLLEFILFLHPGFYYEKLIIVCYFMLVFTNTEVHMGRGGGGHVPFYASRKLKTAVTDHLTFSLQCNWATCHWNCHESDHSKYNLNHNHLRYLKYIPLLRFLYNINLYGAVIFKAKIARLYLISHGTSVPSERVFSTAEDIVSWPLYCNTYRIVRYPYRFTPIIKFCKHPSTGFVVKTDYVFP